MMILGLKLGRRLIAAVGLDDEQFTFHDSRYVASRKSSVPTGTARYFSQLIEQLRPAAVYYYAPTNKQTLTAELALLLEQTTTQSAIPAHRLEKADLFTSVSLQPVRTRRELRERLTGVWPVLAEGKVHHNTVLAEAAASAVIGDLRQEFSLP